MDGTFIIIKQEEIHKLINSTLTGIRFTREEETNKRLPFLDVMVEGRTSGEFLTKVHRKATHTDQVLNFNSNHPNTHMRSCVRTLFKQATTLCSSTELHRKEEEYLFQVLKDNGYPKTRVRRCLLHERHQEATTRPDTLITLPYIRNTSELITRLLRPLGIRIAHKPTSILSQLLTWTKDPLPTMDRTNVICKIPCRDCNKHYIGQTGRKLTAGVQLVTKRHDQYSLISIHVDKENHQFDWDNTRILGQAEQRQAQEFLEALFSTKKAIKKHVELDPVYTLLRRKTG
eukprot:g23113.t1